MFIHRYRLPIVCVILSVILAGAAQVAAQGNGPVEQLFSPISAPDGSLDAALARLETYDSRLSFQTSRIYDRRGELLAEIAERGWRTWVPLEDIPETLQQATVATEDATFYKNPGIDFRAIARALWQNLRAGEIVSGGSTITMQLVRHIALSDEERLEQSLSRKIKEIILAQRLTQMRSKDEILEMYLNEIYYGRQAYGVAAAAETYFGKPVSELSLAESALLAGLPQAPGRLDPLKNLEGAKQRQKLVLGLMVRAGYLTPEEAAAAYNEPLYFNPPKRVRRAPHFVDYVRRLLEETYGPDAVLRGLQVTTTLDLRYQLLAEEIARRHVNALRDRHNVTNASVVVMQPQTGQILAMVGSIGYDDPGIDGQVNVAIRPRQPGSAIKPILYAAAFEGGLTPASVVWDTPATFPLGAGRTYKPRNYDNKFHGPLRIRDALANSYNVPAVKILDQLGIETMLNKAHAMGITGLSRDRYHYGLSLTLGGGEVSLLDLVTAYSTLANGGGYMPPAAILKIVDGQGETIYAYERPRPQPAVDPRAAFLVTDILADDAARLPTFGRNNVLDLDRPAAVKTGTTSDWRDAWTIGYTPYVTVGVWVGNADNTPMYQLPGSRGAGPIWRELMESILRLPSLYNVLMVDGQPLKDGFEPPMGIVQAEICDLKALRTGQGCGRRHLEYFIEGTIPEEGDEAYALRELARETFIETGAVPGITTAEWHISSPAPGEIITTTVPIIGTALFNSAEVSFFKVEFASARAPMTWITMGRTHTTPVEEGQLEVWHAGGLPPGSYTLRLMLVKPDGNWLPPYEVPVRVAR